MRLMIVSFPQGGPRTWSEGLAKTMSDKYNVSLVTGRLGYLKAMFSGPDVLHSNVALPFTFAKQFVLTIHADYRKEKMIGRFLFPIAIKRANVITVPSRQLQMRLGLTNSLVVPNAVYTDIESKKLQKQSGAYATLGILTNFHFKGKAEGAVTLAHCIKKVSSQSLLVIGGDGKYLSEYRKKIETILPNTKFLGFCNKEDLFNQIDIFAYFSYQDNQPIVLLEAMASGLPTISNAVGAIEELFVEPMAKYLAHSESNYLILLHKLLNSYVARDICGQAGHLCADKFSWTLIGPQYEKIYDQQ